MIWALWSVFEEMPHLPRHVDAASRVLGQSAQMVFVDGAYPEFPSEHRVSKDGTAGFCKDAGFYLVKSLPEPDKRTAGLRFIDQHAFDGDWIVVLDGDEELSFFVTPQSDVGSIDFIRASDGELIPRTRVYRWKPGLEFRGRHFTLYSGGEIVASLTGGELCGAGVHHNDLHSPERKAAKDAYYSWLTKHEWEMAR